MGIQQGSRARHRQGRGALAGEEGAAWLGGSAGRPARWAAVRGSARRAGGPCRGREGGRAAAWPWPSGWVANNLPEGGEGEEGGLEGAMKLLQPELGRKFVQFITTDYYTITASLLIHCYRITAIILQIVSNVMQLLCITTNHYYALRINFVHYYTIIRLLLRITTFALLPITTFGGSITKDKSGK